VSGIDPENLVRRERGDAGVLDPGQMTVTGDAPRDGVELVTSSRRKMGDAAKGGGDALREDETKAGAEAEKVQQPGLGRDEVKLMFQEMLGELLPKVLQGQGQQRQEAEEVSDVEKQAEAAKKALDDIDWDEMDQRQTVQLTLGAMYKLLEAQEQRLAGLVGKQLAGQEEQLVRAKYGDFDDYMEGPDGILELLEGQPRWTLEKAYKVAKGLRAGGGGASTSSGASLGWEETERPGTRNVGSAGVRQRSQKPGDAGELDLDAAISAAAKEMGINL
jgi:hypothetical protein